MHTSPRLAALLLTALAVAVLVLVGGALLPPHAALPVAPLVVPFGGWLGYTVIRPRKR